MTISTNHPLKNSGAYNANAYFDKLLGNQKRETYPAVCVVPADVESDYKVQKFTGNVTNNAPKDMSLCFNQYVLRL